MKKLISAMLICVLMFTLTVPALGESGYEIIKTLLADTSTDLYLGTPMTTSYDKSNEILLMYTDGTMGLFGVNNRGQGELAYWFDVDLAKGVYVIYTLAQVWDTLSSLPDSGYKFVLVLCSSDGEDQLIINDAASAANFVTALEDMISK